MAVGGHRKPRAVADVAAAAAADAGMAVGAADAGMAAAAAAAVEVVLFQGLG